MKGRLVYQVAQLISDTATQKIVDCMEPEDDPYLHLKGSLVLALVANEATQGTSKEELLAFVSRIYDVINHPSLPPPALRN